MNKSILKQFIAGSCFSYILSSKEEAFDWCDIFSASFSASAKKSRLCSSVKLFHTPGLISSLIISSQFLQLTPPVPLSLMPI